MFQWFATGISNTSGTLPVAKFAASVVDTSGEPSLAIYPRIFEKI
jgi:hypothetical protein